MPGKLCFGGRCIPSFNIVDIPSFMDEPADELNDSKSISLGNELTFSGSITFPEKGKTLAQLFVAETIHWPAKGPYRRRMIARARKLRKNFTETFVFEKKGDSFFCHQAPYVLKLKFKKEGDNHGNQGSAI